MLKRAPITLRIAGAYTVRWNTVSDIGLPLLVEASAELLRARLLTLFPASRWYDRELSTPDAARGSISCNKAQVAKSIGRAVESAGRNIPFGMKCLHQAIAARRMLSRRRIPATVSIGIDRSFAGRTENKDQAAHAWVTVDGHVVCGAGALERYAVIAQLD